MSFGKKFSNSTKDYYLQPGLHSFITDIVEASTLSFKKGTFTTKISGSKVGKEFEVIMRGKGPHEPDFAYDIVRILTLMIHKDPTEFNFVGDMKAPFLRCSLFISKRRVETL